VAGGRDLLAAVTKINDFRNTYVAHQEQELTDSKKAENALMQWISGLRAMVQA
jgi:type III restriction enzyme